MIQMKKGGDELILPFSPSTFRDQSFRASSRNNAKGTLAHFEQILGISYKYGYTNNLILSNEYRFHVTFYVSLHLTPLNNA
jgi:hypothetical protein